MRGVGGGRLQGVRCRPRCGLQILAVDRVHRLAVPVRAALGTIAQIRRAADSGLPEDRADGLDDQLVVLELGQAGHGNRADASGALDQDRECATVRRVDAGVES